jgi:pyruvate carboxylase
MKVGVPVVPGTPGPVDSYEDGATFIKEHGFPGQYRHDSILKAKSKSYKIL